MNHGTKVIYYLKMDQSESFVKRHLEVLAKWHLDLIGFPFELYVEKFMK